MSDGRRQGPARMRPVEISEFVWSEDRIAHIGRHNVEPEEFEEVCFGKALVLQVRSSGMRAGKRHEDSGD